MARESVTVWDDEAPRAPGLSTKDFGEAMVGIAIRKGMPPGANYYSRRNEAGNGTIFEWD